MSGSTGRIKSAGTRGDCERRAGGVVLIVLCGVTSLGGSTGGMTLAGTVEGWDPRAGATRSACTTLSFEAVLSEVCCDCDRVSGRALDKSRLPVVSIVACFSALIARTGLEGTVPSLFAVVSEVGEFSAFAATGLPNGLYEPLGRVLEELADNEPRYESPSTGVTSVGISVEGLVYGALLEGGVQVAFLSDCGMGRSGAFPPWRVCCGCPRNGGCESCATSVGMRVEGFVYGALFEGGVHADFLSDGSSREVDWAGAFLP